jgi:hypothetical protein
MPCTASDSLKRTAVDTFKKKYLYFFFFFVRSPWLIDDEAPWGTGRHGGVAAVRKPMLDIMCGVALKQVSYNRHSLCGNVGAKWLLGLLQQLLKQPRL